MKPTTTLPILALIVLFAAAPATAQVPSILNYQGRVTVAGTNLTTNAAQFKFALVNSNGTSVYWKNDGTTTTNAPSTAVPVAVAQGLYSTLLGDTSLSNMAAIPGDVFTNANVNLRVWFSRGGTNPFVQLSPDQRLGAAGYALRAAAADKLAATYIDSDFTVNGVLRVRQLIGGLNEDSTLYSTIAGGSENNNSGSTAVIGGGYGNNNSGADAVIGGGQQNTNSGWYAVIGGGQLNTNSGDYAVIVGGQANAITNRSSGSVIAGGINNKVTATDLPMITVGVPHEAAASISGGFSNTVSGRFATVSGGQFNQAIGNFATVPGGLGNVATTDSFAAGTKAKATNPGTFVWADSQYEDFGSTTNNQFLIRAAGGVGINTNNPGSNALSVNGTVQIGTVRVLTGSGAPTMDAPNGSLYINTDGTGLPLWIRMTNGWIPVALNNQQP